MFFCFHRVSLIDCSNNNCCFDGHNVKEEFLTKIFAVLEAVCLKNLFFNTQKVKRNCGFKGALTSFGVICKVIAYSIQSRLLYVPAKFHGLTTDKTKATSNFLRPIKTGNLVTSLSLHYGYKQTLKVT